MILKCKMCGGDMEYTQGASVMECPYCGTTQTLPKVDDERLGQMHSRANHLRLMKEFDKAQMIYEEIIAENPKDAEAHWCALLCRYGIEYVEDPYSRERKPTMHRTQFDAITEDAHYLAAVEHADSIARDLYEREAQLIDRIRRRYLSIASKEEPFDIFICYKETGTDGQRTKDSVYAQEIYNELTREGYKVFFARITLEDKLGEAYEPYIFAALGSAKVMLVVGTSAAHMQAEWVKNEWKRYLYLMKQNSKKKLIPVYRDMEAYDMPEEFVYMQAQDYGKIGALQDLVRGVEKIAGKKTVQPAAAPVQQTVVQQQGAGVESLMRRAQLFLEDGDWKSANEYLNKVLDIDPEYAPAYFGKIMASYWVHKEEKFATSDRTRDRDFENDTDWKKAIRFAAPEQKLVYEGYLTEIRKRRKYKEDRNTFDRAVNALEKADTVEACQDAEKIFRTILGFEGVSEQITRCQEKAEELRYKSYQKIVADMNSAVKSDDYRSAATRFGRMGEYRDCVQLAEVCRNKAQECYRQEEEKKREEIERHRQEHMIHERNRQIAAKKAKKRNIAVAVCAIIAAAAIVSYVFVLDPMMQYNKAEELFLAGEYDRANKEFIALAEKNYKDAALRVSQTYYVQAEYLLMQSDYNGASSAFTCAGSYSDAQQRILEPYYVQAERLLAEGKYAESSAAFVKAGDFNGAGWRVCEPYYVQGEKLLSEQEYEKAAEAFLQAGTYSDAEARMKETVCLWGEALIAEGKYDMAIQAFDGIKDYSKAKEGKNEAVYCWAKTLHNEQNYSKAVELYMGIRDYKDVHDLFQKDEMLRKTAIDMAFVVGGEVQFGRFEQDNNEANGDEPIDWIVLSRKENRALLLSKYVLAVQYNKDSENPEDAKWVNSTIRAWLNKEFMEAAFMPEQQNAIIEAFMANSCRSKSFFGGEEFVADPSTYDKVFCLSEQEIKQYVTEKTWKTSGTDSVISEYPSMKYNATWVTRTRCGLFGYEDDVSSTNWKYSVNELFSYGGNGGGIRPAIWVDMDLAL